MVDTHALERIDEARRAISQCSQALTQHLNAVAGALDPDHLHRADATMSDPIATLRLDIEEAHALAMEGDTVGVTRALKGPRNGVIDALGSERDALVAYARAAHRELSESQGARYAADLAAEHDIAHLVSD